MIIKYIQQTLTGVFILFLFLQVTDCNMRICGFKLTATLQAICRNQPCGVYKMENNQKRSIADVAMAMEEAEMNSSRRWHLTNRSYGNFHKKPKKSVGVATACCIKKCSFAILKTYCCSGLEYDRNNRI